MKKGIFLFIFAALMNGIQAQVPSSCTVPPILADNYSRDIKQLVIKRLFDLQSPDTSLVRIPQGHIDSISEGLAAIFNATSIPQSDSVFNMYCVHNKNGWPGKYDGFLVQVDTNYSWTQAWQNLTTISGNPGIDTVVTRYSLTVTNFYIFSFGNYALLSTDSTWNIFALIDSLNMNAGVITAEPNSMIGGAGKIFYSTIGNIKHYDFTFEFNDCFDGCDNYRNWKFKVYPDCSVEYLGFTEWGVFGTEPLPAPINCNIFTSVSNVQGSAKELLIAPNPSQGIVLLQMSGLQYERDYDLSVFNVQGQLIYNSVIDKQEMQIDLSAQEKGIYFIRVSDDQSVYSGKIAIQ